MKVSPGLYPQDFDVVDSLRRGCVDTVHLGLATDAAFWLLSATLDLADSAIGTWPVVGLQAPALLKVRFGSCHWKIRTHLLTSFLADESAMTETC